MIRLMSRTACLAIAVTAGAAQGQDLLIDCGSVFDSESARVLGRHHITVTDGRVTAVKKASSGAADALDLSEYTCLPGLIDLHVHLDGEQNPRSYVQRYEFNEADYAFRSVGNAHKTLHAGFTAVRNVGDRYNISIALRKAIDGGLIEGPRIFSAGKSIATTGGHADPTNAYRADLMGDPGPAQGVINGPADAAKAVRQRYKDGADLIKITATGGVLSTAKSGLNPQFSDAELKALMATAADYGMKVAAHAHGAEGMKRAIRAGIHSIEHGTLMDDEVMDLMVEHKTWLVPTIMAGEWVAQKAAIDGYFPDIVRPKAAAIGPQILENTRRAYKRGVPIAFGTDSGVSAHGDNAQEFVLLVRAGVPPAEALQMATFNAAQVLDQADDLGTIGEGQWADIVAVRGDPTKQIELMLDIPLVIKGGVVVKSRLEGPAAGPARFR